MKAASRLTGGGGSGNAEQLSPRDWAVLLMVGHLRLLTGGQLQRLFFAGTEHGSANPRIARRTLQRLVDAGLLHRLERRQGGLHAGSSSFTYGLTPKGGRAVSQGVGRGLAREPGLAFVRHTLAISEVVVQLHEAKRGGRLDGLELQPEPRSWRDLGGFEGVKLKPDLFVLVGTGDIEHLAFLEIDLGSEHGPTLQRKAKVYERYFRSGREQQRLGVFPRVVWLVPDDQRREYVERALARARDVTHGLHRVRLLSDPVVALTGPDEQIN